MGATIIAPSVDSGGTVIIATSTAPFRLAHLHREHRNLRLYTLQLALQPLLLIQTLLLPPVRLLQQSRLPPSFHLCKMKFALEGLQFRLRMFGSECGGTSEGIAGVSEVEEVARLVGEELVDTAEL